MTRRAKKASTLSAVVVRFSPAGATSAREFLSNRRRWRPPNNNASATRTPMRRRVRDLGRRDDMDLALKARMTEEIARLFPRCPADRAEAIAAHTSVVGKRPGSGAPRRDGRWPTMR